MQFHNYFIMDTAKSLGCPSQHTHVTPEKTHSYPIYPLGRSHLICWVGRVHRFPSPSPFTSLMSRYWRRPLAVQMGALRNWIPWRQREPREKHRFLASSPRGFTYLKVLFIYAHALSFIVDFSHRVIFSHTSHKIHSCFPLTLIRKILTLPQHSDECTERASTSYSTMCTDTAFPALSPLHIMFLLKKTTNLAILRTSLTGKTTQKPFPFFLSVSS